MTLKSLQLPITDVLTFLLHQFSDPNYDEMTNYEDLVGFLYNVKRSAERKLAASKSTSESEASEEHEFAKRVAERKQKVLSDSS